MDALERKRLLWGLSLNLGHPCPVVGRISYDREKPHAPGWMYGFYIETRVAPGIYRYLRQD